MSLFEKKGLTKLFYFPLIILFFGVFSQNTQANFEPISETNKIVSETENNLKPLDSIVMIDLLLRIDADQNIKKVDVLDDRGKKVLKFKGCKSTTCEYDLSGLIPGVYVVAVLKGNGQRMSQQITIEPYD